MPKRRNPDVKIALLLVVTVFALSGCKRTEVPPAAAGDASLRAFLPQWEEAQSRFLNGDPTLWKQHTLQTGDATIFGAFGGYEKGWSEVGPRYDWAASQYKASGARKRVEYLNTAVSGDLAFTVGIERDEVQVSGQDKPAPRSLRVTQVFRRENGAWKLLHRHADPLLEKKAPPAAPQR
jgi:ketosteroid isomerase-like protein